MMGLIVYWMIGLNMAGIENPFMFFVIVIVISLTGGGMGLALGSAIPDAKISLAIAPLIFIPMMLFSGFYVNADSLSPVIAWI
jgi:ABC-type multidrug transport system permease subunit